MIRVRLANIVGVLDGLIVPLLAVPGKPAVAGLFEPDLSCLADGLPSSLVFVVGCYVADGGVPHGVPVLAGDSEFGGQRRRVGDRA